MDEEENHSTQPYGSLIQNFNRWLLSTLSTESVVNGETPAIRKPALRSLSLDAPPSAIDQVLGIRMRTTNTCTACHAAISRETVMHVLDVQYPRKADASFCDVLQNSILRDTDTKATCPTCKRFVRMLSKRTLAGDLDTALPPILSINANVITPELETVWKSGYLPDRLIANSKDGVSFGTDGRGTAYNLKVSIHKAVLTTVFGGPSQCRGARASVIICQEYVHSKPLPRHAFASPLPATATRCPPFPLSAPPS